MLMLSVLACVSGRLPPCGASLWSQICLLHLADVRRDFMVDRKKKREPGIGKMVCDCVRCMCSEANWSRVSRMRTRLTARLQHSVLVHMNACTCVTVAPRFVKAWVCICVCVYMNVCMWMWMSCTTRPHHHGRVSSNFCV